MEHEQRVEMIQEIRRLHGLGEPQNAIRIKMALDEDRYFMGGRTVSIEAVPVPSRIAKRGAWAKYALEVSEIDPTIIKDASRTDIIGMLEANGLIERLEKDD